MPEPQGREAWKLHFPDSRASRDRETGRGEALCLRPLRWKEASSSGSSVGPRVALRGQETRLRQGLSDVLLQALSSAVASL